MKLQHYLIESIKRSFYVYKKEKGSSDKWRIIYKPKFSQLNTAWKKARKLNVDDTKENGTGIEYEYAAGGENRPPRESTYQK